MHFLTKILLSDPNSGGPLDFAKGYLFIKYVYALHMRELDDEKILPLIQETFQGN